MTTRFVVNMGYIHYPTLTTEVETTSAKSEKHGYSLQPVFLSKHIL